MQIYLEKKCVGGAPGISMNAEIKLGYQGNQQNEILVAVFRMEDFRKLKLIGKIMKVKLCI